MLYGISAVFDQMHFSTDAVLDALDVSTCDTGTRDIAPPNNGTWLPAQAPDTPSSTR